MTHALLIGSPAIDAGDPSAVVGEGIVPQFDQRVIRFGAFSTATGRRRGSTWGRLKSFRATSARLVRRLQPQRHCRRGRLHRVAEVRLSVGGAIQRG